jgi:formylmethanofuran dehydrogenase subunit E
MFDRAPLELSVSLQEHLALSASLHRRLCPRQVLGVRMARLACIQLRIDPALQRKRIFVYMENGNCIADGVIAVTYASPTNQFMQLISYGKMAATFVHLVTGQALRVYEHPNCRETARAMLPDVPSSWEAHLQAYQIMPDELLLSWQPVELLTQPPKILGKHKVVCDHCGDYVHEHCEVQADGLVLCEACAHGAYYRIVEPAYSNFPEVLHT